MEPERSSVRNLSHVTVSQLWRYPVKSLRGEQLRTADITADGIAGDRVVHVGGARGLLTGRTRHGLLTVPADTGPDGVPRVGGHRWDSPDAAALVRAAAGPDARLVADRTPERFDVLDLLVATDGAVDHLGRDVRRLRPNIVLSGVPAELEVQLPGTALAIGAALIGVHSTRSRCIVTTIDPDTGGQDLDVLRRIRSEFGGELALDCWVIRPGIVAVGEPVRVVPLPHGPARLGGWVSGADYPHVASL